jgi:hypothetical protein
MTIVSIELTEADLLLIGGGKAADATLANSWVKDAVLDALEDLQDSADDIYFDDDFDDDDALDDDDIEDEDDA